MGLNKPAIDPDVRRASRMARTSAMLSSKARLKVKESVLERTPTAPHEWLLMAPGLCERSNSFCVGSGNSMARLPVGPPLFSNEQGTSQQNQHNGFVQRMGNRFWTQLERRAFFPSDRQEDSPREVLSNIGTSQKDSTRNRKISSMAENTRYDWIKPS